MAWQGEGFLKRSGRIKPRVRNWRKELDLLARKVVFLRDGDRCVRCGATNQLQWAHINSRRYLSTRWDTRNSCVFCAGCHLKWHHRPLESAAWFELNYPVRAAAMRAKLASPQRIDREMVRLQLELERKKLEA